MPVYYNVSFRCKKIVKNLFILSKLVKNNKKNITIVAAIRDDKYLIPSSALTNNKTFILVLSNFISRIIAQTTIQPGLSLLYIDIFNYKGSEFYTIDYKQDKKTKFCDLLMKIDGGVPIGIINNDNTFVNPNYNMEVSKGNKIVVFSNDDNSSHFIDDNSICDISQKELNRSKTNSNILVLGYNNTINELFDYLSSHNQNISYCSKHQDVTITNDNVKNYSSKYSLDSISDLQESKQEYKKVAGVSGQEKLLLSLIYLNKFTAQDQLDASKYDIEHLCPKKMLEHMLDPFNGAKKLPISSFGNLCLLPEWDNRKKKDKTLYQDEKYLDAIKEKLSIIETKYSFTSSSSMTWTNNTYADYSELQYNYINFINNRYKLQKNEIIKTLFD